MAHTSKLAAAAKDRNAVLVYEINRFFGDLNLRRQPVPADGTCFFHAIVQYYKMKLSPHIPSMIQRILQRDGDGHMLRTAFVQRVKHEEENDPFINWDDTLHVFYPGSFSNTENNRRIKMSRVIKRHGSTVQAFCNKIQKQDQFAEFPHMALMAEFLQQPIYVYYFMFNPGFTEPEVLGPVKYLPVNANNRDPIHLVLWEHSSDDNHQAGHFDLLVNKNLNFKGSTLLNH